MPEGSTLVLFAVAAVTLLVIPGPAVLYIVTRSVDQGRAAGLASVCGVHVGTLVHVAAAASACRPCWCRRPPPTTPSAGSAPPT